YCGPRSISHCPRTSKVSLVHQENAARPLALAIAERGDINAFGAAVDSVRPAVAGSLGHGLWLDHLDELRLPGVGLGVEDVDARRPQSRHHQVAALRVGV